jgi:hypothetical protein
VGREAAVDIVIAAAALAMSTLFYILAGDFPHLAADPGGLALFPRVVAVIAGVASAAFLVQAFLRRQPRAGARALLAMSLARALKERRLELMTFALVGLLPFAIQALGFNAAMFVFTALVLAAARVPLIPLAATTALTTAGIYVAYAIILGAHLPTSQLFD